MGTGRCSVPDLLRTEVGCLLPMSLLLCTSRPYAGSPRMDGEVVRKREEHTNRHTKLTKHCLVIKSTGVRDGEKTSILVNLRHLSSGFFLPMESQARRTCAVGPVQFQSKAESRKKRLLIVTLGDQERAPSTNE